MLNVDAGKKLFNIRLRRKKTLEFVALKTGKSESEIKKWEKGEFPGFNNLKILSILYSINYDYLCSLYNRQVNTEFLQYKYLPSEISDITLSQEEQNILGTMYLKVKTNESYVAMLNEENPFVLAKTINHLIELGLVDKKEKYDGITYKLSLLGFAVCDIIEENPNNLFCIQQISPEEVMRIMSVKYLGFSMDVKTHSNYIQYIPMKKSFDFLLSDNKFKYKQWTDYTNVELLNSDLYEFVFHYLPDEFFEIIEEESTNKKYLKKKEELKAKNCVEAECKYDIYIRPTEKGKNFAKYFLTKYPEIKFLLK